MRAPILPLLVVLLLTDRRPAVAAAAAEDEGDLAEPPPRPVAKPRGRRLAPRSRPTEDVLAVDRDDRPAPGNYARGASGGSQRGGGGERLAAGRSRTPGANLSLSDVSGRVASVKVYAYPPPPPLAAALGLQLKPEEEYFHIESELLAMLRRKSGQIGRMVSDPEEADFFWVPHALHAHKKNDTYVARALLPFLSHIVHDQPFFNRSEGRDHVFVYVWDNGPLCDDGPVAWQYQHSPLFQYAVHPMIIVGYHGMRGFPRPPHAPSHLRKECFWAGHDITMPQLNRFHSRKLSAAFSYKRLQNKASRSPANLYYTGSIYSEGMYCSRRIRVWTWHYMRTCAAPAGPGGAACTVNRTCADSKGVFALCPAGWGCWSSRFFDAIDRLAIPVILADGIVQPFERFLDYRSFTAKVTTGHMHIRDIHHLQQEVHLNAIRFPILEDLHDATAAFRRLCIPCDPNATEAACLAHPVSRKLRALAAVRPWFSWDLEAPRNALKLFVLELYCRTARGREEALCRPLPDDRYIAHAEYGV